MDGGTDMCITTTNVIINIPMQLSMLYDASVADLGGGPGAPFLPADVKIFRHNNNIHDHKINANTSYFFL